MWRFAGACCLDEMLEPMVVAVQRWRIVGHASSAAGHVLRRKRTWASRVTCVEKSRLKIQNAVGNGKEQ